MVVVRLTEPNPRRSWRPRAVVASEDGFARYSSEDSDFVEAAMFHCLGRLSLIRLVRRLVSYIHRKIPAPGTQMDHAVRYVKRRDRQQSSCFSPGSKPDSTKVQPEQPKRA